MDEKRGLEGNEKWRLAVVNRGFRRFSLSLLTVFHTVWRRKEVGWGRDTEGREWRRCRKAWHVSGCFVTFFYPSNFLQAASLEACSRRWWSKPAADKCVLKLRPPLAEGGCENGERGKLTPHPKANPRDDTRGLFAGLRIGSGHVFLILYLLPFDPVLLFARVITFSKIIG